VLKCVAVCCIVLQSEIHENVSDVLQGVAVCCSVLQYTLGILFSYASDVDHVYVGHAHVGSFIHICTILYIYMYVYTHAYLYMLKWGSFSKRLGKDGT